MKVTGPGSGLPVDGTQGVGEARAEKAGKAFAAKLDGADRVPSADVKQQITADITAELKAGRLPLPQAIEKVVERVLARQLGSDAPAQIREKVRAALREAIDNDPLLAEKMRGLAG